MMFCRSLQEYVSRQLGAMSARIAEDRAAAEKLAAETAAMRAETAELQTKVGASTCNNFTMQPLHQQADTL